MRPSPFVYVLLTVLAVSLCLGSRRAPGVAYQYMPARAPWVLLPLLALAAYFVASDPNSARLIGARPDILLPALLCAAVGAALMLAPLSWALPLGNMLMVVAVLAMFVSLVVR